MKYIVQWEVELSADTPEGAARAALEIMRDPESTALFFKVMHENGHLIDVDLLSGVTNRATEFCGLLSAWRTNYADA